MPELRVALPADRPAAVEVWRAAQGGRGLRPPATAVTRITEKVAGGLLVVAEDGDDVIGMALGEPGRERDGAGDVVPGLLHLSMAFVVPPRQRQGVGSALVEALADAAWNQGYRSLSTWTPAPEFLQACGFERSGRIKQLPDGTDVLHLTAELEAPVQEIVVRSEGIRLGQLLKLAELVQTGAEGKELLEAGGVELNGEVELRRGRQLVNGDEIRAHDRAVRVLIPPTG